MQHNIKELLDQIAPNSESFQDENKLVNIPWILIEEEPADRKIYLLKNHQQELTIYANKELLHSGKWGVSKTTAYLSVEIDGETTFFERGFLNDTIMLLEKDDGTYRIFINAKKLKDKAIVPSFESCLSYLAKFNKKTTASAHKKWNRFYLTVIAVLFLVLGIFIITSCIDDSLSSPSWGFDLTAISASLLIIVFGIPCLIVSAFFWVLSFIVVGEKNNKKAK